MPKQLIAWLSHFSTVAADGFFIISSMFGEFGSYASPSQAVLRKQTRSLLRHSLTAKFIKRRHSMLEPVLHELVSFLVQHCGSLSSAEPAYRGPNVVMARLAKPRNASLPVNPILSAARFVGAGLTATTLDRNSSIAGRSFIAVN
jgi:hypothetical protein